MHDTGRGSTIESKQYFSDEPRTDFGVETGIQEPSPEWLRQQDEIIAAGRSERISRERLKRIQENLDRVIAREYRDLSFANFQMPAEMAKQILSWIKNPSAILMLIGPPGTGKTALMGLIYRYFIAHHFEEMKWTTHHEIVATFKSYISSHQDSNYYRKDLIDYKFLFIDDFGNIDHNTDYQKDLVTQLIHDRGLNEDKPTIISSNLTKNAILKKYEGRVESRLFRNRNMIIDFWGLCDYRKTHEVNGWLK